MGHTFEAKQGDSWMNSSHCPGMVERLTFLSQIFNLSKEKKMKVTFFTVIKSSEINFVLGSLSVIANCVVLC